MATAVSIIFLFVLFAPTSLAAEHSSQSVDIAVQLSTGKRTYARGASIELTIKVVNIGSRGVYIYPSLGFSNSYRGALRLLINGPAGCKQVGSGGSVDHAMHESQAPQLAREIQDSWLLLQPHEFLGVDSFPVGAPSCPGVYYLSVIYETAADLDPRDLEFIRSSLPNSAFLGRAKSNAIRVIVH